MHQMETLAAKVERLKEEDIKHVIDHRMNEFRELGRKGNEQWFYEMCFCIMTANTSAKSGIEMQRKLGQGLWKFSEEYLTKKLKEFGYRYPVTRAKFIVGARLHWRIKDIVTEYQNARKAREWLVAHITGLGWKESSHFLRNVGYGDVAILDRHILRTMLDFGMIDKMPKALNKRLYLEYEQKLEKLAEMVKMSLGQLDLYLWYMKTGNVLK